MNDIPSILAAGLESQDWRETASITADWRRFGKFGRGAAYVVLHDCRISPGIALRAGELWFGPLHKLTPEVEVVGPMLDQVFDAGCRAGESRRPSTRIDADTALDELTGGSDA